MKDDKRWGWVGIFLLVMIILITVFYYLEIMALVYIFIFSLVAGLYIFYSFGGFSKGKWVAPEELMDEEEALKQLEEYPRKGLVYVEDEDK